jgi:hypothetical protein
MNARDRSCGHHVMVTCQRPRWRTPRHRDIRSPLPFAPGSKATVLSLRRKHPVPTLSRVTALRWQVSWLAGLRRQTTFPGLIPSGAMAVDLAAHSCGGSHGFARHSDALTAFPFDPT